MNNVLTSKLDSSLFADDGAVDILDDAYIRPGMFFLNGISDHQVPSNQTVMLVWLLHQLDFPVISAPPIEQEQ